MDIHLSTNNHRTNDRLCLMEMVALLAGEEKTDWPACACPVVTIMAIKCNDHTKDQVERDKLIELAPMIVGSVSTAHIFPRLDVLRAYITGDHHRYQLRVFEIPAWHDFHTVALSDAIRCFMKDFDNPAIWKTVLKTMIEAGPHGDNLEGLGMPRELVVA